MQRIYTRSIAAHMVYNKSIWNCAKAIRICNAVGRKLTVR